MPLEGLVPVFTKFLLPAVLLTYLAIPPQALILGRFFLPCNGEGKVPYLHE